MKQHHLKKVMAKALVRLPSGKRPKITFASNENGEVNKTKVERRIQVPDEYLDELVECLGILLGHTHQSTKHHDF